MKSTGIVRKLDELGRITLPKELRRTMGLGEGAPLEIHVDDDAIVLKKYISEKKTCTICGATHELVSVDLKHICLPCYYRLSQKVKHVERRSPINII